MVAITDDGDHDVDLGGKLTSIDDHAGRKITELIHRPNVQSPDLMAGLMELSSHWKAHGAAAGNADDGVVSHSYILAFGRPDEGSKQVEVGVAFIGKELRVPLNTETKPPVWKLNAFDNPIGRHGADGQIV